MPKPSSTQGPPAGAKGPGPVTCQGLCFRKSPRLSPGWPVTCSGDGDNDSLGGSPRLPVIPWGLCSACWGRDLSSIMPVTKDRGPGRTRVLSTGHWHHPLPPSAPGPSPHIQLSGESESQEDLVGLPGPQPRVSLGTTSRRRGQRMSQCTTALDLEHSTD